MNKQDFLKEIKEAITYITPHEEDDDFWRDEGLEFLTNKQFDLAEKKFKELIMSQPKHHDGYEGLAYAYYFLGKKERALWFMQKSIEIAETFLENDSIDVNVIDEMKDNLNRMSNDKQLNRWWETR
jgi:tetratricopeptide (TPR) repeat protein